MTTPDGVPDLVRRWAAAEQQNDAGLLDGLLAADFVGVGPLGFVLNREQWLVRFANGLVNRSFAVEDPQVRDYGTAAVVVGVLAQETSWHGGDNSGRFRVTLVAVRSEDRWLLALIERHLTRAQWRAFLHKERARRSPRERPEFLAWVLDDADERDMAAVLAEMPPPARLVYRMVLRPRYDAQHRWRIPRPPGRPAKA